MRRAVICFTRVPRPGVTKTRLLPVLSPKQCAALHTAFLKDLARVYRELDAALFVAYAPDPDWALLKDIFPMASALFPQTGESLGERMDAAMRRVLSLGFERVILTGTDLSLIHISMCIRDRHTRIQAPSSVADPVNIGGIPVVDPAIGDGGGEIAVALAQVGG